LLEDKFKLFRDLFTRKTARIEGFENVGGLFVREYGELANRFGENNTGLHYHCLIFDNRSTPSFQWRLTRSTTGVPTYRYVSDLEDLLRDHWLKYMKQIPLTPEYRKQIVDDWSKMYFSEPVTFDSEGVPGKLKNYFVKLDQKTIQIPENSPKPRWYGWLNERALSFRSHGDQITPRAA
jgi:hypothetical protein